MILIDKGITCGLWLAAIRKLLLEQQTQPEGRKPQAAGHGSISSNGYSITWSTAILSESKKSYQHDLKSDEVET